jgi:hypothetical protein
MIEPPPQILAADEWTEDKSAENRYCAPTRLDRILLDI